MRMSRQLQNDSEHYDPAVILEYTRRILRRGCEQLRNDLLHIVVAFWNNYCTRIRENEKTTKNYKLRFTQISHCPTKYECFSFEISRALRRKYKEFVDN